MTKANLRHLPGLVILLLLAGMLYLNWTQVTFAIVQYQKEFHEILTGHVKGVAEQPLKFGILLMIFSLLYGVFHAAGPGHGKAILVTYLSTQKETFRQGVVISFLAALLQSVVAILLIAILVNVLSFSFRDAKSTGMQVEQIGYALVVLIGVWLVLKSLWGGYKSLSTVHSEHHVHEHDEHCAHHYTPVTRLGKAQMAAMIFSMGLRPCSGAVLVLIYAQITGVFLFGIFATLAMGLGTGITVAALAWLSVFARERVRALVGADEHHHHEQPGRLGHLVSLLGGLILIWLGFGLMQLVQSVAQSHPLL